MERPWREKCGIYATVIHYPAEEYFDMIIFFTNGNLAFRAGELASELILWVG